MSVVDTSRQFDVAHGVGRFSNRPSGSSTFRLSATPVSMSLTGSRFSSDSAPMPAPIIDEASLLQHAGHKRHAGTSDTQHFAEELLRERNVIAAEQVMAS